MIIYFFIIADNHCEDFAVGLVENAFHMISRNVITYTCLVGMEFPDQSKTKRFYCPCVEYSESSEQWEFFPTLGHCNGVLHRPFINTVYR